MHKYVLKNGPIKDQVKLLKYTGQILDALIYLEDNNIVHKDIKPSNILIDSFGTIKLADFGLSAFYDKNKLSEDYSGSTAFLAPEIVSKKPHNPVKSDIWSLGVSLYFIAVGNFPFPSDDHDTLVKAIKTGKYIIPPNINKAIRIIITHSLLMNPDERMTFY